MGRFFRIGKDEAKSDSLANPAAQPSASDSTDSRHPLLDEARQRAEAELQASPRRRGRPSKDTASLRADSRALPQDLQNEIQKQIEGALDPRAWSALLALPADTALAITGREHWKISKDERETLGATGSAMARTLMIQNPKTLCAIMLSSALFSAYVPRAMEELKFQRIKKAREKLETTAAKKSPSPSV
jgi:hypothetical protein